MTRFKVSGIGDEVFDTGDKFLEQKIADAATSYTRHATEPEKSFAQGYRTDPRTGLPVPGRSDPIEVPPALRCPKCGGEHISRIGSNPGSGLDLSLRCVSCGNQRFADVKG